MALISSNGVQASKVLLTLDGMLMVFQFTKYDDEL